MRPAVHRQLIVAGRRQAGGGPPIEVRFPFTGERISWLAGASSKVMDDAVAGALEAFAAYRQVPAHRRAELLHSVSQRVADRQEQLAGEITLETGKTIRESRVECEHAATTFRTAAEEATRIDGEVVPLDGVPAGVGRLGEVRHFPVGPVAAITPFNSPLNLVAHNVAPALAAGNTVIVKPSPDAPLSALNVGNLVLEAAGELELPAGVISVVPCADEVVETLVTDPRVGTVSFTGSSRVGWVMRSLAGQKRVLLELGGNGAVIVHRDADIDHAAERCAYGAFALSGQACTSVQRVYVHETVADAFMRLLVARASDITTGDPRDEGTQMGPMRSEDDARRAAAWIEEAVAEGARVLCGAEHEGPVFLPTVLTDTQHRMRIVCEEALAPVVVVERYSELDDAIAAANATEYGLQAGIFSNDLDAVYQAYRELEVGGVIVNDVSSWRVDHMPYGGVKASGLGRAGLRYAIREQMEPRLLVLNGAGAS